MYYDFSQECRVPITGVSEQEIHTMKSDLCFTLSKSVQEFLVDYMLKYEDKLNIEMYINNWEEKQHDSYVSYKRYVVLEDTL